MHLSARDRLKLEDTVRPSQLFKTLHYGLKRNHERHVAVVHPLMFLLRRVVYALVIIFMDDIMVWGVFIVMANCMLMLAYALSENPWQDSLINYQHVLDESTIYVLCLLMLTFSNYVDGETRYILGFFFIGICFAYVVYNTIVIIVYSLHLLWLYLRRVFVQCRRRRLRDDTLLVVEKLNHDEAVTRGTIFNEAEVAGKIEKQWFEPNDGIGGGFRAELVFTVDVYESQDPF